MAKQRLEQALVKRGLVASRSQANSYIQLGKVMVNDKIINQPDYFVAEDALLRLTTPRQYVSRAGHKLESVAISLGVNFTNRVVLDVGSSTGGFTDYALKNGAKRVIAVELGTNQLHPSLRLDPRVELYERTDIRQVYSQGTIKKQPQAVTITQPDIIVMDVSFVSLRELLPHIVMLMTPKTQLVAMFKPQFESANSAKHQGVIKNDHVRRDIIKQFESWVQKLFIIVNKADSAVLGSKGNRERFYLLQKL